jgi:adenosylhomocysteine nucleosidase
MLGVVVALPWELKSLTRQAIPVGTCKAIRDNTWVALSGIGAEHAYAAGALLASQGATALLSWGCAAALDDRLKAGSVLLPECIIGATGEGHAVTADWHRRLYQTLSARYPVSTDALVESVVIVKTSAEKRALARRTPATATDMESAAQARLAQERRLPFAVVRAVVDTASTDIPQNVMQSLGPEGDISVWKFLGKVLLCPADWSAMVKLGMQFNAARKTLKKISRLVLDTSQVYLDCLSPDATTPSRG